MILSFADKETEKIYNQHFSKKIPQSIQKIALRKLMMIDAAECLADLRIPPANRLCLEIERVNGVLGSMINGEFALRQSKAEENLWTLKLLIIIRRRKNESN